ncbi:DEAD/DEAH box helicase family protein [Candidatus Woesearchaeota archaeon]|jgi:type I restriction enzyme, R subunit|nr:DEAD/DEAH box helicase family protein [Candidatus Woesearchaeota archaeon]MBT6336084.1 DEAD/DEAH box helicase family protein [Candidatus Woesearchaeota archaeon]MBT7927327.1 DEAD/DEAH box helicase family protein [Candidatus Woesearchaeota archaeon]
MNEDQTRKVIIDKQLDRVGWKPTKWEEEVNTVKSRFKEKHYELVPKDKSKIEKGDHFADYILLASDRSPLAIVEAKSYSKNQKKGSSQAITYRDDIEKQIRYKLPIFLTNGRKWEFVDSFNNKREVFGPFSREDLERRRYLFKNYKDPKSVKLNKIIDRKKSQEVLEQLSAWFSEGHRYALIEMATGTGKTFVSMGLIDLLKRSNNVKNVLFIADRIALADQAAEEGFTKFFKEEPITKLHREKFTNTATLYSSTLQTLMKNKAYKKFSPGFFDLIVFDEAHRSILGFKPKELIEYFDAIKVGLTATPRDLEDKSTYELFKCEDKKPTVEYSYYDAVDNGTLVLPKTRTIFTKILTKGLKGDKLNAKDKDKLRRQEEDPDNFEATGKQYYRKYINEDTNKFIIKTFLEYCYYSDDNLPAKTIFFCMCQKHAEDLEELFHEVSPRIARHCKAIISDYSHSQQEIKRFKNQSSPRIAFSVGMLDTGVNIPEVCNLVFIKPVMSHIRFWQMFGRGTRSIDACKHYEWLPNKEKNDFKLLDFAIGGWSNVKEHKIGENKEKEASQPPAVLIFANRVKLLESGLDENQKKIIVKKIHEDLSSLDTESLMIREKTDLINELSNKFNLNEFIDTLNKEILPLMRYKEGDHQQVASFILKVERLFNHILKNDEKKTSKIKEEVQFKLRNVWEQDNITEVKKNIDKIEEVISEDYWQELTFEKVENIVRNLAPLMKYYSPQRGDLIKLNIKDEIILDIQETKKDDKVQKFFKEDPLVKKLKEDKEITPKELSAFAERLVKINPALTIDNIRRTKKDFIDFIFEMVGLTHKVDSKQLIKEKFDKFMVGNYENQKQQDFLLIVRDFFAERKNIKLIDFTEEPLDQAWDLFEEEQIEAIVEKCQKIKFK